MSEYTPWKEQRTIYRIADELKERVKYWEGCCGNPMTVQPNPELMARTLDQLLKATKELATLIDQKFDEIDDKLSKVER
jgi:hypothetical protein